MKRFFGKRSSWFNLTARILLFAGIIIFISIIFITKEMYIALLPVAMGVAAFAKYLYDIRETDNGDIK